MGFGDVRLGVFGGLGLGHATRQSVVTALAVLVVVTCAQAIWTFARTHDRRARFAYGPALVVALLVAAN